MRIQIIITVLLWQEYTFAVPELHTSIHMQCRYDTATILFLPYRYFMYLEMEEVSKQHYHHEYFGISVCNMIKAHEYNELFI